MSWASRDRQAPVAQRRECGAKFDIGRKPEHEDALSVT